MARVRAARGFAAGVVEGLGPFWVVGLAVLQLVVVGRVPALGGERYEWVQYLGLGTLFPAAVLALTFAQGLGARSERVATAARRGLAAFGVATSLAFVARHATPALLGLATAHAAILGAALASARRRDENQGVVETAAGRGLATWLVLVVAWVAAARVCYWSPFESWVTRSPWALAVLAGSVVVVSGAAVARGRDRQKAGFERRRFSALDMPAVLVLVPAAFRLDSLGGPDPYPDTVGLGRFARYHWGPIVGPAELVRQGGWLLWDVPSQYGLLNTLVVAWLPLKSVWQSLYVVNAALTAGAALIVYMLMRSVGGRVGRVFALLTSFAAVYLVAGDLRLLTGPSISPCLGPYRFFWCYALVGLLAAAFRSSSSAGGLPGRGWLAVGCVAWLLGTFWSAESATYAAAVWLPAYAWVVARRAAAEAPGAARWRETAWLALPPALLAGALGAIHAVYVTRLGHAPDWRAFFDYSLANIGHQSEPIDPAGAVWALLLALLVLTALAAHALERRKSVPASGALAVRAGAWGGGLGDGQLFRGEERPGPGGEPAADRRPRPGRRRVRARPPRAGDGRPPGLAPARGGHADRGRAADTGLRRPRPPAALGENLDARICSLGRHPPAGDGPGARRPARPRRGGTRRAGLLPRRLLPSDGDARPPRSGEGRPRAMARPGVAPRAALHAPRAAARRPGQGLLRAVLGAGAAGRLVRRAAVAPRRGAARLVPRSPGRPLRPRRPSARNPPLEADPLRAPGRGRARPKPRAGRAAVSRSRASPSRPAGRWLTIERVAHQHTGHRRSRESETGDVVS